MDVFITSRRRSGTRWDLAAVTSPARKTGDKEHDARYYARRTGMDDERIWDACVIGDGGTKRAQLCVIIKSAAPRDRSKQLSPRVRVRICQIQRYRRTTSKKSRHGNNPFPRPNMRPETRGRMLLRQTACTFHPPLRQPGPATHFGAWGSREGRCGEIDANRMCDCGVATSGRRREGHIEFTCPDPMPNCNLPNMCVDLHADAVPHDPNGAHPHTRRICTTTPKSSVADSSVCAPPVRQMSLQNVRRQEACYCRFLGLSVFQSPSYALHR